MARDEPPVEGDERTMLVGWLDFHRETLAIKCEGLTNEQLAKRSVPPSTMSLLGLLRHMTEIERTYFRRVFAGEDLAVLPFEEDPFGEEAHEEFASATVEPDGSALAAWREEVASARAIIDATESLDAGGLSGLPMRFWLVKTLNEYARHNGHADLLRESVDGTIGE